MALEKDAGRFPLSAEKMPKHIAIIMDGNGRWAKKRGLPRKAGHKAGAETLEKIISAARELGLEHLTVYAFSTERSGCDYEFAAPVFEELFQKIHQR